MQTRRAATVPFDLDAITNSRFALSVASGVGRMTPASVGHRLAEQAADALAANRGSQTVIAIRSNQWVASGESVTGEDLDVRVRATLRHIARCTYDLYHLAEDPSGLARAVHISESAMEWIERIRDGQAAVLGSPHLSNFDLGGRALAARGFRAQVLSVPDPTDAYRTQNELRSQAGLEITPISTVSLKAAYRRLEQGGAVLTGIDRPLTAGGAALRFFGRMARLPDVHIRLAQRTGAPLVMLWVEMDEHGVYVVRCERLALPSGRGREAERAAGEVALRRAEQLIAAHPAQWAMPHAVWPQAVKELESLETAESEA